MSDQFNFGGEIVWQPSQEYIERSNLKSFMDLHSIKNFNSLMERSTIDVAWFTDAIIKVTLEDLRRAINTGEKKEALRVVEKDIKPLIEGLSKLNHEAAIALARYDDVHMKSKKKKGRKPKPRKGPKETRFERDLKRFFELSWDEDKQDKQPQDT